MERTLSPHPMLARIYRRPGLAIPFATLLCLPLIPILLALRHRQLALHTPVARVKPRRDERVTLDLRLGV